jgi:3-hydroxyacyl-[acyl-carrier-protein] dehydratase
VTPVPLYAVPLRAVDRIELTPGPLGIGLVAHKCIVATDPYLEGHFPARPVFPGVFVVEAVRQAVLTALASRDGPYDGASPDLCGLRSARFLAALRPGDELAVEATVPPLVDEVEVVACCRRSDGVEVARITAAFGYHGSGSPGA